MCPTMRHKHNSIIHLNHAALQELRNDSNSCVEVKSCHHHLTLHPFHLTNISESIKEILHSGFAKYHKEFNAILLGYQNVKILGYKAPMSDDTVYMHTHIEADFYLFKPVIGSELHGIVNKKSQDHIGCLVHQLFNISLPKPRDVEDWLGYNAKIGHEIKFRITFMQLDARLPYIRGEIIAIINEDSGISTSEETAIPKKNKGKKFTEDTEMEIDGTEESESHIHKKKKKSKKKKLETKEEEAVVESIIKESSKKKKKKKSEILQAEEETPVEAVPEPHKKKKKSKHRSLEAEDILEANESESYSKKKKSKKDKKNKSNEDCNESAEQNEMLAELKKMYETTLNALKEIEKSESEPCKKRKDKKEKKKSRKNKELDNLDDTLSDLNLDELFNGYTTQSQLRTSMDSSIHGDIVKNLQLPPDSDMEEVLKDVKPKLKSPKGNKRKRESVESKTEGDTDYVQTSMKKKKKRDSI